LKHRSSRWGNLPVPPDPVHGSADADRPLRGRPPLEVRVGSSTNGLEPVSAAQRQLGATRSQWLALGAIGLAAIAADQLTKELVSRRLGLGEQADVIGPFSIHHVQNTGIAFGLFPSATALVTTFTALAVAWMLYFFARSGSRHALLPVALGFLIGGSASNLLDRLRLGHVTDFLDVRYWPAFNLADSFIVVGVLILLAAVVGTGRGPVREGQLAHPRRRREDAQTARS
jgi:signal peptidase II